MVKHFLFRLVQVSTSYNLQVIYLRFLTQTFTIHRTQGKWETISLTPLHRYLDVSRAITAECSTLHIASDFPGQVLTTKLQDLEMSPTITKSRCSYIVYYKKALQRR